jgi:hypothetical protein
VERSERAQSCSHTSTRSSVETLLTPSTTWGGDKLIGANIRFCTANAVVEFVWHILVGLSHSAVSTCRCLCFSLLVSLDLGGPLSNSVGLLPSFLPSFLLLRLSTLCAGSVPELAGQSSWSSGGNRLRGWQSSSDIQERRRFCGTRAGVLRAPSPALCVQRPV